MIFSRDKEKNGLNWVNVEPTGTITGTLNTVQKQLILQ